MRKEVVLAGGVRTPIGSLSGALAEMSAPAMGAAVVKQALERAAVPGGEVDEVIMGNVIGAGLGQNVARQAAIGAGLPVSVGAMTVNKVCGSGLKSVMLADQAIQCGDASVVVAGGMESMTRAPYLLEKARQGYRMGHGELVDSMIRDGLWDVYSNLHMGMCGDRCAERYEFSRSAQDEYAITSYKRALQAAADGSFAREIVPLQVPAGKNTVTVSDDEEPKRFNEDKLRQLRPAFGKEGTITAGNASSVNDGAAAVVVLAGEKAQKLGVKPQARILGYATASVEPEWFTIGPVSALRRLLDRISLEVSDIDVWEINEAFSVVPMVAMKELGIPHDRVNVFGGAVALGHPIGASGTRVLVTLLNAMASRKAKRGIATLCIGGGEAVALAVEAV
ncbi:MAG TPA: thiolase family protein [Phycisphaerae bacterium]|nr:thiolase family protein [Phycisphaerae bacterium]HOM51095.1 thiolase family protein [Phycisphaerae bacterium]HON66759.1 thiolase family protein [Phycisphaerae bacterium]HPP25677.1 thiolase family protein [Phycisphaerae bacterium]